MERNIDKLKLVHEKITIKKIFFLSVTIYTIYLD